MPSEMISSYTSALGNTAYNSLGGACSANPFSCLTSAPTDYCSTLDAAAFMFNVATPFFAGNPGIAFLTHLGSRAARIFQERDCLPPNVIPYSNHTETALSLIDLGLILITPSQEPVNKFRQWMQRNIAPEQLRGITEAAALAKHQTSGKASFAASFPVTYKIASNALTIMSLGASVQEQYEVNLRKAQQGSDSGSFFRTLMGTNKNR